MRVNISSDRPSAPKGPKILAQGFNPGLVDLTRCAPKVAPDGDLVGGSCTNSPESRQVWCPFPPSSHIPELRRTGRAHRFLTPNPGLKPTAARIEIGIAAKERKDRKKAGIAAKRHKKRKKLAKIMNQIRDIAMIGSRLASGFRPLYQILILLFFAIFVLLCGYSCSLGPALPFLIPPFCAFCAFLRLFPYYLSASGLKPWAMIFCPFGAEPTNLLHH